MKLKHCITALSLILAISFTPKASFAQDEPPSDPDETTVPFDGGISLLVAAGVAYGIKKKYDSKKQVTGSEGYSKK